VNTRLASSIFMPSKPPRSTNPVTSTSDPAEDELFRAEMAADGVVEIKLEPRAELQKPRPKPIAAQRMADEAAVPAELLKDTSGWDGDVDTGDNITFLRNGLGRDVLKKLKRGHWAIQSELDLHGHTTLAARDELARFLAHARHNGLRCVRIIHGRGTRSVNNVPLLRNKVRLSLSQRDEVLAFCDAGPADGGAGAVLVLLKSS
jgi:DNA-nicking Smr family endonuclease